MCNMDCFNCSLRDCVNNELSTEERKAQDEHDREIIYERKNGRELTFAKYNRSENGRARTKKYRNSAKGKETIKNRESTEKAKERYRRYSNSERGKVIRKQYREQLIASGKNAEYCRAYYQRQKEKKLKELISEPA